MEVQLFLKNIFKHLEGYSQAKDTMEARVRMLLLQQSSNILLEPAVVFLLLLTKKGHCMPMDPMDQQLAASSSCLPPSHTALLGLAKNSCSNTLHYRTCHFHCLQAVKSPHPLGGAFLLGFPKAAKGLCNPDAAACGSAVAWELMHHNTQHNVLNHNRGQ